MDQVDYMSYDESIISLKKLRDSCGASIAEVETNRLLRHIDFDVFALQQTGKIGPDETMVAMRLIDTNIRREQPTYVSFLTQSNRLAIFKYKDRQNTNPTEWIEEEFNRVMRYVEWETPFFRIIDGVQTHGYDFVEIVFDESKPGHISIEHVGTDNLFFSTKSVNLQHCEEIIRGYDISIFQLRRFVSLYGFNKTQVDHIFDVFTGKREDTVVKIHKRLRKQDGIVYVAWFCFEHGCDNWLRVPEPLYLGVEQQGPMDPMLLQGPSELQKLYETEYPIIPCFYTETEEPTILAHKGRVFADKHKQEAQSCIATGFINKLLRSSDIYAAVETSDTGGGSPRQLDVKLQHGSIYDKPLRFFGSDAPDAVGINALQFFDAYNAQEAGQISYAANNRQDTRKTATEITAAKQESQLLSGVSVTIFSTFLRKVFNICWRIVQNRAQNNKLTFCMDVNTGENTMEVISADYDVFAAGDLDVVKRQEKIGRLMQFLPVVAGTPIASVYLSKLLQYAFPDESFDKILELETDKVNVIKALNQLLGATLSKEEIAAMSPAEQQQITEIQQKTMQYL